jgi:KH domain
MQAERGIQCAIDVGTFFGRGGSNIKQVRERTGTFIYRRSREWVVYYPNQAALRAVKGAMGLQEYHY